MEKEQVKNFLKLSVEKKQIAGAYLISGGNEEIRNETGMYFARLLNCSISPEICGKCSGCIAVEKNNHPDVKWIVPEKSVLSIDEVRMLKEEIYLKPYMSPYKIFMLKINWMRAEAANSFLKILEEPPDYGIIVFLSKTSHNFLQTILSRCVRLKLNPKMEETLNDSERSMIKDILAAKKKKDWRSFFFRTGELAKSYEREEMEGFLENLSLSARDAYIEKEGISKLPRFAPECIIKNVNRENLEKILTMKNRLRYNVNVRILLETILWQLE